MEEIWREVADNKDYQISNRNGWRNIKRNTQPKGRVTHGYRVVSLGREGGEYGFHTLVAKAFPEICGEWFEGCVVHHINYDKFDNRPENLVVLSQSEHAKLHYKTQPDSFKKPSDKRSASISKALTGRKKYKYLLQLSSRGKEIRRWDCITDVQKELGYSRDIIHLACKGKLKTAYGFKWQYAVS